MTQAIGPSRYSMAAVIRFTLLGLYLALVAPLPLLAPAPWRLALVGALVLGLALVVAATSEEVAIDAEGIAVGYPSWCNWLIRRSWSQSWSAITGLTAVATSQGGRVFYLRCLDGSAYLLPQRIARFDEFLELFSQASGLDSSGIGRISPPWTYQLLALLSGSMLVGEATLALAFKTGN
ncbi:hypothetical protein KBY58_02040 [Cyanobium sp. HWJ4-Hawea]|uniref:hypothetical protein n=1 Tax=Cyanobium sp. HWJ4-Hawea TaxID=2823713 RepID=UPI0020CBE359|nr:hypothetical protein [Cyanobium sp. HWJ4-Hawea]MCP9808212.1 hypothetical protein [Cyanobium sp. HWJ4-Hawea]